MTGSHVDDPDSAPRRRPWSWRLGTPLVVLLSGALFAVSAVNSEGTDLRPGRYVDLATLVENESDAYQRLNDQAVALREEVDELAEAVDDRAVRRKRQQAERLRDDAGLEPVTGDGLRVVLSDAPDDQIEEAIARDPEADLDPYVVHQQDIQAVVNAMWAGGAEAVTIQGQRIVTTTGIKCTGSSVQLQGVPYPEPYVIEAVGDVGSLIAAVDADQDVTNFREDVADPTIGLGWELDVDQEIEAPAYAGLVDISYARPLR